MVLRGKLLSCSTSATIIRYIGTSRFNFTVPSLLIRLIEDQLSEVTYDAELAALSYSLSCHARGVLVSVGGYNDRLPVLLQTIIGALKTLSIDPERLAVVTEQVSDMSMNLRAFADERLNYRDAGQAAI